MIWFDEKEIKMSRYPIYPYICNVLSVKYVMVVGFQPKGRKDLSSPDNWRLKGKTKEFNRAPVRFGLGTPKCMHMHLERGILAILLQIYALFCLLLLA